MQYLCCLLLFITLLLPSLGWAETFVCEITATPGKFSRFVPSIDPTKMKAHGNETCGQIQGDTATAEQRDLVQRVPQRYLKVVTNATVGGVVQPLSMAEMDPTEQNAVDTAITDEVTRLQSWKTELETPAVCKYNTPTEIDTKVNQFKTNNEQTIQGMTLGASDKTALITVMNRIAEGLRQVTKCDAARASGG